MPKAAEMLAHEYIYTRNLELSQISMNYSAPIPERLVRWCDHQLPVRNIPRASAAPATKPTPIAEPWTAETCALVPNTAAPCRRTSSTELCSHCGGSNAGMAGNIHPSPKASKIPSSSGKSGSCKRSPSAIHAHLGSTPPAIGPPLARPPPPPVKLSPVAKLPPVG